MTGQDRENGAASLGAPLLFAVGEALYGEQWQSQLARALGVSERSMRYWVAGRGIPLGAWVDMLALLVEREERVMRVSGELRAALAIRE